ncbi:MAG TPA: cupin domain-containing protein [Solirubrobacterales bacterium]|jgi:quercetin dioxygenase-like cupin family protein
MKIIKGGRAGVPSEHRTSTFSGDVWGDPVLSETDEVLINSVSFGPAGRTYWHSHAGGQVLIVTSGAGLIYDREGDGGEIDVGDIVFVPPGVEHWHGARPDTTMVHLAISFRGHDWLEEVSDADYGEAAGRSD